MKGASLRTVTKIHVIGLGYRPLSREAHDIVLKASAILASRRLYEVFQRYEEFGAVKEKILVINRIEETMQYLHAQLSAGHSLMPLVLLASGDPLYFGIGRRILNEFSPDSVEILPDLSSMQLAFSRIKEPWDNAFLMSLHGGPDPEKRRRLPYELNHIPALLEHHAKIAILTDRENNPAVIAKTLLSNGRGQMPEVRMFVCEKLGYPDEKIISGSPEEIAGMSFANPNVVIVMRIQGTEDRGQKAAYDQTAGHAVPPGPVTSSAAVFGLTEDEIVHSRGLITKDEVRAVSLHTLRLPVQGVFWDIGAGSGSVSVEAARMHPGLKIYAIEKNEEQAENIRKNITGFCLQRLEIIQGEAPDALGDLPSPDRVFIGGSGGRLSEIIKAIMQKMQNGIIVLNAISLETLNDAMRIMSESGLGPDVSQISVCRSRIVNGQRHMAALNPIFIVKGEKR